jgi:uncharacterized membrane protein
MHDAPPVVELLSYLLPIVTVLIALPLVLRSVPPNRWYGFRTRKTLSNPDLWYEANYKGGVGLIVASVIALVGRAILLAAFERGIALLLSMFFLMVCMVVALSVWGRQMRNG